MALKNIKAMVTNTTIKAWWIIAKSNFQTQLLTRSSAFLFIVSKLLNFAFTLLTVLAIFTTTKTLNGYTLSESIVFVLVYGLGESLIGFLFRAIYFFRPILVRGDFDLDLLRPLPSFFRPLLSSPDFLDFFALIVQILVSLYVFLKFNIQFQLINIFIFLLYLLLTIFVAFSIDLIISAICVLTTEVDNLVWLFRSVYRAGVVPTDIYYGAFRFLLDYIIPITLMVTLPSKALLGLLTPLSLIYTFLVSVSFFFFSWFFWRFSLRQYQSASS